MSIDPNSIPESVRRAMDRKPALVPPVSASDFLRATKANPLDARNAPEITLGKLLNAPPVVLAGRDLAKLLDSGDSLPASCPPEPVRVAREQGKASMGKKPLTKTRQMNKTERRFADLLDARKRDGEILHWVYEGIRLKWGGGMHYLPDFCAFDEHGMILYETKGSHVWDRDVVRFKGARNEWPQFRFEMWKFKKGTWSQMY